MLSKSKPCARPARKWLAPKLSPPRMQAYSVKGSGARGALVKLGRFRALADHLFPNESEEARSLLLLE